MNRIPIIVEDGLWLNQHAGNGELVAELFRETWGRLPSPVRTKLLAYWGGIRPPSKSPASELPPWPVIALKASKAMGQRSDGCTPDGMVDWGGGRISFNSRLPRLAEPEEVRFTIAHELAHVYQFATEGPHYGDESDDGPSAPDELAADAMAREWGFCSQMAAVPLRRTAAVQGDDTFPTVVKSVRKAVRDFAALFVD